MNNNFKISVFNGCYHPYTSTYSLVSNNIDGKNYNFNYEMIHVIILLE